MTTYRIPLNKGKETIVDEETFAAYGSFNWYCDSRGYAARSVRLPNGKQKEVLLHRLVVRAQEGEECHHVDRDRLNNLPQNLVRLSRIEHRRLHALQTDFAHAHSEKLPRGNRHWARTHPESVLRGEQNGNSKLTEIRVIGVMARWLQGASQHRIAREFGVCQSSVHYIVAGKKWKHLFEAETVTEESSE